MIEFDFDVAWDAASTFAKLVEEVLALAEKWEVDITGVQEYGPGGGNPYFSARTHDDKHASEFLVELYRDPDDKLGMFGLKFQSHAEMLAEVSGMYKLSSQSPGTLVATKNIQRFGAGSKPGTGSSWTGSFAIILPKGILKLWGWDQNTKVNISIGEGQSLVITKAS